MKKIKGTKEKGEEAAKTIDDISTVADPNAPLDKQVKSVTNTAIRGAKKANRNNDANNIQNFQNKSEGYFQRIQNSINRTEKFERELFNGKK